MSVELRLPNIKGATPEEKIEQLQSYIYQLVQELNFYLNLDSKSTTASNDSASREFITRIEDTEGNFSSLSQTVDGINAKVSSEGSTGTLDIWADNVQAKVSGKDGQQGSLEIWKDAVQVKVSGEDGKQGSLEVWADKVQLKVSGKDGEQGSLEVWSDKIETKVSADSNDGSLEKDVSTLTQTVNGFEAAVVNTQYQYNTSGWDITYEGVGVPTNDKYPSAQNGQLYINLSDGELYQYQVQYGYGRWVNIATFSRNTVTTGSQISALAGTIVLKAYTDSDGKTKIATFKLSSDTKQSDISLTADSINLNGYTKVNSNFSIDTDGLLHLVGTSSHMNYEDYSGYPAGMNISDTPDVSGYGNYGCTYSYDGIYIGYIPTYNSSILKYEDATGSSEMQVYVGCKSGNMILVCKGDEPTVRIYSNSYNYEDKTLATKDWVEANFKKNS